MKNLSLYTVLLLLTMIAWSCDHDTETFDGPNLVDRFGPFTLLADLEVNRTTVDFAAGQAVRMTAQFNKNINFVIRITGQESGAVKIIEAFGRQLDETNAVWRGGTTELPFFREEMCLIELIIPEENLTQSVMVEVVGTRVYEGSLFADFESSLGNNVELGNFEFELTPNTGVRTDGNSAEGNSYYLMEGTDNVLRNFFCGLHVIKSSVTGSEYAPVPTTVPEDLYFNAFLYSDGRPHTIAVIEFVFDSNDNGAYDDTDALFKLDGDFPINWTGWRQISHTMADIGMTEEQVSKIVGIRLVLISDDNSQPTPPLEVAFGIDFMTFTSGGPLEL